MAISLNSSADAPIYLRELGRADLSQLNRWRNDPELISHLGNNFLFIAGAVDEVWYEDYLKNRDRTLRLSIIERGLDRYIGNVNLVSIHPINRSAEISIMLGDRESRGKGYGTLITRELVRHAFQDRGLHRLYCTVVKENKASIRMFEKAGFRHEGINRQAIFKNGAFHDMVTMAILAEEFQVAR